VLFRIRVHPLSKVGALPDKTRTALVREARVYAFEFLAWKKAHVLKKHWLAHTRRVCPRCAIPLHNEKLGRTRRRSFFCTRCQVLYDDSAGSPASPPKTSARKKRAPDKPA
jgi:endonuclease-8